MMSKKMAPRVTQQASRAAMKTLEAFVAEPTNLTKKDARIALRTLGRLVDEREEQVADDRVIHKQATKALKVSETVKKRRPITFFD